MQIAFVLILLLVIMILFSLEIASFDLVVLLGLIILVSSGILSSREAFEGFGNDFIILLIAIFLIGSSLQHNGIIDYLSESLIKLKKINAFVLLIIVMLTVGLLSAFMNNTTIAAVFIAPIISVCRKFKISPSKFLMPMAFASLMGGTCTLIGTSTNVAGSAFMQESGIEPLNMFELFPLGIIILLVGIIYMVTIGYRMLPGNEDEWLPVKAQERTYNAEVLVPSESPMVGKSLMDIENESGEIKVIRIYRKQPVSNPAYVYQKDILLIRGTRDALLKFQNVHSVRIKKSPDHQDAKELKLAEIMVLPTSSHLNATFGESYFQQENRASILAVHRKNELINKRIKDITVRVGDILLIEARDENLDFIRKRSNFIIISEVAKTNIANLRKGWLTLLFFVLAIIVGSLQIIPLSIAFLITAVFVVLIKAVPADRMHRYIDWRLILLIGGMTAFGTALQKTGADVFLAERIVDWLAPYGKYSVLAGFMLLTVLLTQPMSNAAAALVILPIAIQTSELMLIPVRPVCIAIIASASISMIAPFEPCSLLVFTAGKYKMSDFIKIGGLLTIISLALILWLVPLFWGF